MSAWFSVAGVAVTGVLLAGLGLRAAGLRGGRLLRHSLGFGPGLGLGLASLLLFFCRTFGLARPGAVVFVLVAAVVAGVLALQLRRARPASDMPEPRTAVPRAVQAAAVLVLLATLAGASYMLGALIQAWPLGTWDAVAIWNARARFLYLGYEQAPELLKQVDPSSHPNYPLLVPGAVAAQLAMVGDEDPRAAQLTGLVFLLGLGLLTFAVAADSGSLVFGAAALALLGSSPMLLKWGASQGADVPMAYFFLGSVAVLASRLRARAEERLPPFLGGVFLGLLAWSKNEGALTALLLVGLYAAWVFLHRRRSGGRSREAPWLAAGLLPGLAAVCLFKALWAPESGMETFLQGHPVDRLLVLGRWMLPVREIVRRLVPFAAAPEWALTWPAVLSGVALAGWVHRRAPRPWVSYWGAALLGTVASWVPIYAVTPYGQAWHVAGSLDRLYVQILPAAIAGVFLRLGLAVTEGAQGWVPARAEGARRPLTRAAYLAVLLGLGIALKTYVVATFVPRIWLFLDELFYLVTAYDMAFWGSPGVPHPEFLFYPPLTSALIAPLHALGVSPPVVYHLALLWLHILLTSAVLAAYLLFRRLFGAESRLLAAVLVLGPPAYTALLLMSEPVFVALYTWFLYFYVRMLQNRRARDGWAAGLLLAGLVLTRFAGYLVAGGLVLGAIADRVSGGDRRSLALHLRALAPAMAVALLWRLAVPHLKTAEPAQSLPVVLAVAVNFPLELVLGTARRFVAEIAYVSLSSFGFALPTALWACSRPASRQVRLLLLNVFGFLITAAFLAAGFMWFGHLQVDLPRFHMYGRYVEYFAVPLLVVAFGVLLARRHSARERWALAAGTLVLNAGLLLSIPESFFPASLDGQIAPNSLGITWLIRVTGWLGADSRWLVPPLLALLAWALACPGRPRRAAGGALVALAALNFLFAVREVSVQSVGSAVYASTLSDYVASRPQAFAGGVYVDFPPYRSETGPMSADFAAVYRLISDHTGKVVAGDEPERYLGRMPVLTWRSFDRPVLAEWPSMTYRLYAADP